jgi:hypothetical protein
MLISLLFISPPVYEHFCYSLLIASLLFGSDFHPLFHGGCLGSSGVITKLLKEYRIPRRSPISVLFAPPPAHIVASVLCYSNQPLLTETDAVNDAQLLN